MSEQPDSQHEFAAILVTHAKGRAHDNASKLLRELVEAVKLTGKKGDVTVKLTVSPMKNNQQVIAIDDRVTATIPEEKRSSVWFTDDEGKLHRNDPNQEPLWGSSEPTDSKTAAAGRDD